MNISQVIKMLKVLKSVHGDIPVQVACSGYGNKFPIRLEDFRIEDEWTEMFPAKKTGNKCLCLYQE